MKRDIIAIRNFVVAEFKKQDFGKIALPEGVGPMDNVGDMEVIRVGSECKYVKEGDYIIASPKDVIKYPNNGLNYYCVSEDSVRAVIREI
jgi:hypothetical protein